MSQFKPLKIMLASRVVTQQRPGGMPHVCIDRATALADAGHEVHVVTTSNSSKAGTTLESCDVFDVGVHMHYTRSPAHEWSSTFANECKRMANELKPDIVHIESIDRANKWWKVLPDSVSKLACTMHGFGWGAFLTSWNSIRTTGSGNVQFDPGVILQEARLLREFDTVIGVSKHEHRMLRDEYGLPKAKLVYNPLPEYFFNEAHNANRHGFLCAAVSQGATRGFRIAKEAAKQAGVDLIVATEVSRYDMPKFYHRVKAIVLPTAFAQGFDLAVCEARASLTPAIMSATGSYLAEAEPWDTIVEIHDVKSLADVLRNYNYNSSHALLCPGHLSVHRHRPEYHAREWLNAVLC